MIQGHWKLICGEANGQEEPKEDVERSTLAIAGDQHTVTVGKAVMKGTHKLDSSQIPMTIDSTDTAGPFENMSLKGIFKLMPWRAKIHDSTASRFHSFESNRNSISTN